MSFRLNENSKEGKTDDEKELIILNKNYFEIQQKIESYIFKALKQTSELLQKILIQKINLAPNQIVRLKYSKVYDHQFFKFRLNISIQNIKKRSKISMGNQTSQLIYQYKKAQKAEYKRVTKNRNVSSISNKIKQKKSQNVKLNSEEVITQPQEKKKDSNNHNKNQEYNPDMENQLARSPTEKRVVEKFPNILKKQSQENKNENKRSNQIPKSQMNRMQDENEEQCQNEQFQSIAMSPQCFQRSQSSQSQYQQKIQNALLEQSSDNEQQFMIDQGQSNAKKVKIQNNQGIQAQYQNTQTDRLGVYQWNQSKRQYQAQINEQDAFLLRFQKDIQEYSQIKSEQLLQAFGRKIYLKSIHAHVFQLNREIFPSVSQLEQYSDSIRFEIREVGNQNKYFDNQNQIMKMQGQKQQEQSQVVDKQMLLTAAQYTIGRCKLIENLKQNCKRNVQRQIQFISSLDFLIRRNIIQIGWLKIVKPSYKNFDQDQIYLGTRGSIDKQVGNEINLKKGADYEAIIPLSINLLNYYKYVCKTKLQNDSKVSQQPFQQLISQSNYSNIFYSIYQHFSNVVCFLNKTKYQSQILQRINSQISFAQKVSNQQNDQNEQQSYNIGDDRLKVDNQKGKIPNQQLTKQQLQNLFQSGNWFSLTTSKVQAKKPSIYFKGQLKPYQQLTLGWMLYRQNCQIKYQLQRPLYHYKWSKFYNLKYPLYFSSYTHQILNFLPYWKKNVKGGLLCDEMGLGKTVMSLALIDSHIKRKKQKRQNDAGTLIIVPTSVLSQWQEKISQFVPHLSCVVIAKGKDIKRDEILKVQIVLTTFGIVRQQRKIDKQFQFDENTTSLYKFEWFRVIVDEADNLRNHKTFSAKGIQQIRTNYTWLLTGTPIQNKLSDLQSYFNILKYDEHGLIKSSVSKKGFLKSDTALIRIKQTLKDIMVRRKKNSLDQNGNRILQLKQYHWITKMIDFTDQEAQIYYKRSSKVIKDIDNIISLQREFQEWDQKVKKQNMKRMARQRQQIQHIFGQLIKLRQFCCHPDLYNSKSSYITYDKFGKHYTHFCELGYDMNTLRSYNSKQRKQQKGIFQRVFLNQNQLKQQQRRFSTYEKIMSRQPLVCTYCQQVIQNGLLTICLHVYCQSCFRQLWNSQVASITVNYQAKNYQRRYVTCYDDNCQAKIFHRQTLCLPRMNRFNKELSQIAPNKKIIELLNYLKNLQLNQKAIVFTHFIGMIQIILHTLKDQRITATSLMGQDSIQDRKQKIRIFKEDPSIKVMVISTKCGHAGLNLQNASKMYFMQPWWNPAVQEQALGRLHRIGQQNQVQAVRFIIKGSIESIINIMGQQKKMISDFVLDSDSSKKRKKKVEILKGFRTILFERLVEMKQNKEISEKNIQKRQFATKL